MRRLFAEINSLSKFLTGFITTGRKTPSFRLGRMSRICLVPIGRKSMVVVLNTITFVSFIYMSKNEVARSFALKLSKSHLYPLLYMYKCSLTVCDDYAGNHLLPAVMHDPAGNGPVPATLCMDCRKIFFCEKIQNYAIERFVVSPCRKTVGHTFQGARFDRLSVPPNQQAQGPDPTKKLSVPLIPTGSETALFVLRWRRWRVAPEVEIVGIAPRAIRIGTFCK